MSVDCETCNDDGFLAASPLTVPLYCECAMGTAMAWADWVAGDRRAYERVMRRRPVVVTAEPDGHGHMVYTAWEQVPGVRMTHTVTRIINGDTYGRVGYALTDLRPWPEGDRPRVTPVTWQRREFERAMEAILESDDRLNGVYYEDDHGEITARISELEHVG